MKHLKCILIFLILLNSTVKAQETLTLQKCYELAKTNYPLIKRNDLIAKTKEFNIENASKAWLPQINITAQATYQSAVTALPIKLPNLSVEPLSKDQYKVVADISQNIYDGGMTHQQKKMAEIQSQVELQKTEVETNLLEERINQIYFGILQSNEQIKILEFSKNDIKNGLKKAEAQLKNGIIYRSNVDVLKAQLVTLEQKQIELQSVKKSFVEMLSIFIHQKIDENTLLQKPEKLLLPDQNNRAELKLYDLQKQVLETQKSLLNSKNLPKLGAFLQGGYGKPGLNMLKNEFDFFYIGGIRLNIPISGFYTQKNDLALLETQQQDLDIQKENFLFNQQFQTLQNNNDLQKIQKLIDKDNELVTLRESIKKASLSQLENGVITTSDYLREINAEETAKTQKVLHEMQFLLTQYNLKAQLNN